MDEKINAIKTILNGLTCSESIFILGTVKAEVEQQKLEKSKDLIFKF